MTMIINNHEVEKVLTVETTIEALEESYKNLAIGEAVFRSRIDIRTPAAIRRKIINGAPWRGGGSAAGYFALRMKSGYHL